MAKKYDVFYQMVVEAPNGDKLKFTFLDPDVMSDARRELRRKGWKAEWEHPTPYTLHRTVEEVMETANVWYTA